MVHEVKPKNTLKVLQAQQDKDMCIKFTINEIVHCHAATFNRLGRQVFSLWWLAHLVVHQECGLLLLMA